jgi:hypothetical protein
MNNPLWDAFMIEMGNLFAQDEILKEYRAAGIGLERILVISKCYALVRREGGMRMRNINHD